MATFTKVNPGDPIQAHQLNQVIDALIGTTGAGVPIAVTAVNDAVNYALTVQNDESGNSRALNVLKSDGTTLIRADASGVTLGSPLNLPVNSITSAAIADGGIQNVDLGPDVARANLLTNPGFELWQRGNGPFTAAGAYAADRWSLSPNGTDTLSVSKSAAGDIESTACAVATFTLGTGGGSTDIRQQLKPSENALFGTTLSFSARIKTSTANAVRLLLYSDGTGGPQVFSSFHTGNGAFQTLSCTAAIPGDATLVLVAIRFAASCTAYIDNAMLVVGSQPCDYVPMHPADDLARCVRYYEVIGGNTSSNNQVVGTGPCESNSRAKIFVPFKSRKPLTPTITALLSPASFQLVGPVTQACSNISSERTSLDSTVLNADAGSLTQGWGVILAANANTSPMLAIEANP